MDLHKFVEKAEPLRILGIKITQNGELIGEYFWDEDCRRNIY